MFFFATFGYFNFFGWCFLGFLGESMIENYQFISIQESKQAKNVISVLYSCLPNIVSCLQLFEKFTRNNGEIFNQIKNKENFLHLLIGQGVKVVMNWAVAIFEVVETDFSHALRLA